MLAQRPGRPQRRPARGCQRRRPRIASNQEIWPSSDPFGASRAMALRRVAGRHAAARKDALGWQDATERSLGQITGLVPRPQADRPRSTDSTDQVAGAIAASSTAVIEVDRQNANATTRQLPVRRPRRTRPATRGCRPWRRRGGPRPAPARRAAPRSASSVTMSINTVGRGFLGDGQGMATASCSTTCATRSAPRADDAASRSAGSAASTTFRPAARGPRPQRRPLEPPQSGRLHLESPRSPRSSSSKTEDAGIAKTLIDFNSPAGLPVGAAPAARASSRARCSTSCADPLSVTSSKPEPSMSLTQSRWRGRDRRRRGDRSSGGQSAWAPLTLVSADANGVPLAALARGRLAGAPRHQPWLFFSGLHGRALRRRHGRVWSGRPTSGAVRTGSPRVS